MVQIELLGKDENGKEIWGIVDYIEGRKNPQVRFEGQKWECLTFIVGMVGPLELAQA